MKNRRLYISKYALVPVFLFLSVIMKAENVSVIPYPEFMKVSEGSWQLKSKVYYDTKGRMNTEEKHLLDFLKNELELEVKKASGSKADIRLILSQDRIKEDESYLLCVDNKGITIESPENAGLFYGLQTLRQLVQKDAGGNYCIPYVEIKDQPRFKWRGFLLDDVRTFHGMKVVKQLLDELALLKINHFQWHLTDDQGWRIDIHAYPELVKVNSPKTLSKTLTQSGDASSLKGYYTRDEIREIVKYASDRYITIVPEIEMPGHASAAITAYPWLGVDKKQIEMPVDVSGIFLDIFDVADSRTITFFHRVLDEVKDLFPAGIIHIGGDEVNFTNWKKSARVNQFMKDKGIESPADLQLWFTNEISTYLAGKKIRMMGWNDIMGKDLHNYEGSGQSDFNVKQQLAPQTLVHFWKGDLNLIAETAAKGYEIVNAYHLFTYIDYTYESISLEKAYSFEPVPEGLAPSYHKQVIGLSCQMWGGSVCPVETVVKLQQQIFPRVAAYAEVGWTSPQNRDFNRFDQAVQLLIKRWKSKGISVYSKPGNQ